ncbi:MAG: hypothetical protein WBA12_03040, partial [Catalinimonas sp.]
MPTFSPYSTFAVLFCVLPMVACAQPGGIHTEFPAHVDPDARYVIYLHGRIIEEEGRRPTHPRYGTYEYDAILDTLAAAGLEVISEQRASGTDITTYTGRVATQVRQLLAAGVPPEHVTVVGFSKGGGIAVLTAARLQNDRVNFVFLACCNDWLFDRNDVDVRGRMLS